MGVKDTQSLVCQMLAGNGGRACAAGLGDLKGLLQPE